MLTITVTPTGHPNEGRCAKVSVSRLVREPRATRDVEQAVDVKIYLNEGSVFVGQKLIELGEKLIAEAQRAPDA